LTGLGEAVRVLSVDDRPRFIETIDEGGVLGVGPAFFGAPAHAQIAVAKRQHGFRLRQELRGKSLLDNVPLVGRIVVGWRLETLMMEHCAASRSTGPGLATERARPDRPPRDGRRCL